MSKNIKIYKYVKDNTLYDINTKRLHIYDGIITSPVISFTFKKNYQISKTMSGSIYITVPATFIDMHN